MNTHEFEIALQFEKGTRDPSRIFIGMAEYIDTFTAIDSNLLSTFDAEIQTHLELDDIQTGSIRTIVRRVLEAVDDSALKDGNWSQVIGRFLHRAKHSLLKWCEENKQVNSTQLVKTMADEINDLAKQTHLHHIPSYRPYTPQSLVRNVQSLAEAGRVLQVSDTVLYRACGESIAINRTITFLPDVLEELLEPESDNKRVKAVVVIKKPDYLGDSQWELRYEGHTIRAHIQDGDWITSFRKRQFEIKPGDALRVILDIRYELDEVGKILLPQYEVKEVLGIVPGTSGDQQLLIE